MRAESFIADRQAAAAQKLVDAQEALYQQQVRVLQAENDLVKKQVVAVLVWQQAQAAVDRAAAEVSAAQFVCEAKRADRKKADLDADLLQKRIASYVTSPELTGHFFLTAPTAGIVTECTAQQGECTAGLQLLFQLEVETSGRNATGQFRIRVRSGRAAFRREHIGAGRDGAAGGPGDRPAGALRFRQHERVQADIVIAYPARRGQPRPVGVRACRQPDQCACGRTGRRLVPAACHADVREQPDRKLRRPAAIRRLGPATSRRTSADAHAALTFAAGGRSCTNMESAHQSSRAATWRGR